MAEGGGGSEQVDRILAPLRNAFLRLESEEKRRLAAMDPVRACIELLRCSAKGAGLAKLDWTLRLYQAQEGIAEAAGGLLGIDELAKRLGLSRQEVLSMADSAQLVSVEEAGRTCFPANQVTDQNKLVSGLPEVLRLLANQGISGWMALDVLNSPFPGGGLSPMQMLRQGRKSEALKCIDSLQNQGAA